MRKIVILAALALAGCEAPRDDGSTPNADATRRICIENGHTLGSEGFHRCFETTYAAIMSAPANSSGPVYRPATICNRVGTSTICN